MRDLPHPDALDAALLTFVLARHPAPVHSADLARAFATDDWPSSVTALVADGLLHREGSLHVASRATVRAGELLG
jgi:hypothetical protein